MKRYFSTFFALLCFAVLMMCVDAESQNSSSSPLLCSDVLRLHVVANSDSRYDQNLKYKVRDGIMTLTQELFSPCKTVDEALDVANKNKTLLKKAAKRILEENESVQKVNVLVGRAHYPEKTFEGVAFPEGEYLSVRVILGEGEGQNWWCVLFPSLCDVGIEEESMCVTSGNSQKKQTQKESGGIEVFGCRVKLKILEYFE